MRKLMYVSETGKETSSWEIAKAWNERFAIRLDEIHKKYEKWHNPKLREENAKIGIHY